MREIVLYDNEREPLLRLLPAVLAELGFRVLAARNGREVLNLAMVHAVDAVILDRQMAEMTGAQSARELKRLQSEAPIIMFAGTGYVPMSELDDVDAFVSMAEGLEPLLFVLQRLTSSPMTDRPPVRRIPRYSAQLPLAVVVDRAGALQMMRGVTTTVGEGGLGEKSKDTSTPANWCWFKSTIRI